ncbi:MAG: hypothetical protein HOV68_04780, partial [Streptomycetaceae bacterium]|nr:hypothetical protein [Streptomycetaceae bacterium]
MRELPVVSGRDGSAAREFPDRARERIEAVCGPVSAVTRVTRPAQAPVWRVKTRDGLVAVKSDRPSARTAREAAVLDALGHLIASDDRGPRPWLAMPWREGPTTYDRWAPLRDGTSRHIIALRSALLAAADLCRAVAALHEAGWVHGGLHAKGCVHAPDGAHLLGYAAARGPAGLLPADVDAAVAYPDVRLDFAAPEVCAELTEGRTPEARP